jgi:hypothetical protein
MRNFWIESNVDGRANLVTGGPRCNDGRMSTRLYVNSDGNSTQALYVGCNPNGTKLDIRVQPFEGNVIDMTFDKKSGEVVVNNYLKVAIQGALDNKSITPTARLKLIQELIK